MIFWLILDVFGEPLGEPNTRRWVEYHVVFGRIVSDNIFKAYSFGISESSEFSEKQTFGSSTTRNQKNENSENSRATNEGYIHWLKTGDEDIFVVQHSNNSRPTGSIFTKFLISAKSAKPSSSWGRRFWSLRNLSFFQEMLKRIRFRCLQSLRITEEAEKSPKSTRPYYAFLNLYMNNSDAKQFLLANENQFDWSDPEICSLLLKTHLTCFILKNAFHHTHPSYIISWHLKWNIYPLEAKEASIELVYFGNLVTMATALYDINKPVLSSIQMFSSVHYISHNSKSTIHRLQIHIYKNINILSINSIKEESLIAKLVTSPPPPPPAWITYHVECQKRIHSKYSN